VELSATSHDRQGEFLRWPSGARNPKKTTLPRFTILPNCFVMVKEMTLRFYTDPDIG